LGQKEEWTSWSEVAPQMVYRPNLFYHAGGSFGLPEVVLKETMEDFHFLAEHRCAGITIDMPPETWGTAGPQYYLMAQLAWNPFLDGAAVMADYYRRGFGPAAGLIETYWALLEETHKAILATPEYQYMLSGPWRRQIPIIFPQVYNADILAQADALLLMGEIAVVQDSLKLAENYLEQVIERSPDSFTKAQAQFQVGKMRENEKNYVGALEAYQTVSRYKPSESLKVEAIIRQTSMLKALNRDEDAVEMIQDMLQSDKFVDIRGELEVELGKLYLVMDELDRAETKFTTIVEDYNRTEVAAEASYYLGELYLTKRFDYANAKTAFADVKVQAGRSPLVNKALQRNKQIERYEKIQLDHTNLQRQLSGLPPLVKSQSKNNNSRARNDRGGNLRGRSKGGKPGNPAEEEQGKMPEEEPGLQTELVEVTAQDSLRLHKLIEANRYSLAEYMLFEFTRVDTTMEILTNLEDSSTDSLMQHQCAYMQYYAIESIQGDVQGGQFALEQIQKKYPHYYTTIMNTESDSETESDPNEERFNAIAALFETGQYQIASAKYYSIKEDSSISVSIRSKSCFNHAWLNDHYLYDKDSAVESYSYMLSHFPEDPLAKTARNRLNILTQDPNQLRETNKEEATEKEIETQNQDTQGHSNRSNGIKEGEDDK